MLLHGAYPTYLWLCNKPPKTYFAHKYEVWVGLGSDSSSLLHVGRARGAGRSLSKVGYPRGCQLVLTVTWAPSWGYPPGWWLGSQRDGRSCQSLRACAQKLSWHHFHHVFGSNGPRGHPIQWRGHGPHLLAGIVVEFLATYLPQCLTTEAFEHLFFSWQTDLFKT